MRPRRPVVTALAACALVVSSQPARWSLGAATGRIGGSGGDQAAELTIVSQVVAVGDDSVYVVDERSDGVLLFDARGRLVRRIGRRGSGPGEFGYGPGRIGRLGDTLWGHDPLHRQTEYFGAAGRPIVTRTLPVTTVNTSPSSYATVLPAARLTGGRMVSYIPMAFSDPRRAAAPPVPPNGQVGALALLDSTGRAVDTLTVFAVAPPRFMAKVGSTRFFPGPNYFADTPLWAASSDGSSVVMVERAVGTPRYRVTRWDARGTRLFAVDVPYQPIAMPRAVVDSVIREYQVDMKEGGATFDIPKLLRDSLRAPATYVPVSNVLAGTDGSTWVARENRFVDLAATLRYDVLDAAGRLTATVTLTRPGRIAAATANVIWVIETDADDLPMLVRYPVIRR